MNPRQWPKPRSKRAPAKVGGVDKRRAAGVQLGDEGVSSTFPVGLKRPPRCREVAGTGNAGHVGVARSRPRQSPLAYRAAAASQDKSSTPAPGRSPAVCCDRSRPSLEPPLRHAPASVNSPRISRTRRPLYHLVDHRPAKPGPRRPQPLTTRSPLPASSRTCFAPFKSQPDVDFASAPGATTKSYSSSPLVAVVDQDPRRDRRLR